MSARWMEIAGLCGLLLAAGCASVNPMSLPVTAYDREIFEDANAPKRADRQFKVLVRSEAIRHPSDTTHDAAMAQSARQSVLKYFANLGWFKAVDHGHGMSVDAGELVDGDAAKTDGLDYLLDVKSSVAFPGHHFKWHEFWGRGRYTSSAGKANGADVTSSYSLVDVQTRKPLLSARYRSRRLSDSAKTVPKAVDAATDANARKFATVVAARFLPPVRVLETRGGGRCARIKMGENYLVGPADADTGRPATTVAFFTYEKGLETGKNGKPVIEKIPFASGTVIQAVNNRECWVEIDDWERAKVHKGHYAMISDASVREATKDEFNGQE